ncbi:MAG: HD domain-containing protein [Anaerolineae bacterium]|nr:HD domain-containing protein [Anaerolineae bacterium]MDQ7033427.1 HD domain-containing protein [Anaerolineae bacterium]
MAIQRIRQGVRALLAFTQTVDYSLAEHYLSDSEMLLFTQMGRSEQLHSLNVLRSVLVQKADTPHALAVAALLHDVGKSRCKMAVWQKTISVLVEKFLPQLNDRLSQDDTVTFWNAPFVVRRWHPKWSAEHLAAAESSETVIWLARHHADSANQWQDHPYYLLLLRLQQADDEN